MALTHGLVIFLAWIAIRTVEDSNWGKTIRAGKAYRIPWNAVEDENVNYPPSTIPFKTDILFVRHYASDYLASYSRVIDFAHPGNKHWRKQVQSFATGYSALSPALQKHFCKALIDWTATERRFLKQDLYRFWFEVTDIEELSNFCHRELSMASNQLLEALVRQIDSLHSETEFGPFRETAIHSFTIPEYLDHWENRLIPPFATDKPVGASRFVLKQVPKDRKAIFAPLPRVQALSSSQREKPVGSRKTALPPRPEPMPPTPNAWLQEGDRVQARFECNDEGKWYFGEIAAAIPNEASYDINYDDGDQEFLLKQRCVLPADADLPMDAEDSE
mmetsp:Transcript_23584/g.41443  ORF Transcript_23584/g.41443 Transcript_23584/m.41443 type:complete len:332 (-) Transcript_23584:97-1092(-)